MQITHFNHPFNKKQCSCVFFHPYAKVHYRKLPQLRSPIWKCIFPQTTDKHNCSTKSHTSPLQTWPFLSKSIIIAIAKFLEGKTLFFVLPLKAMKHQNMNNIFYNRALKMLKVMNIFSKLVLDSIWNMMIFLMRFMMANYINIRFGFIKGHCPGFFE